MAKLLPNILLFNPSCEYAVANGNANWQPKQLLQKMEYDLSTLPLFFAKTDDYILVDTIPTPEFIASLKQIDIDIPHFLLKTDAIKDQDFIRLSKDKLLPWGWSPAVHKFLTPFKESCSTEFKQSPAFNWNPQHREITSRKFAADILKRLQSTLKTDYILPIELLPKVCTTQNDFETVINKWGKVMIKAPWSSSGRGLQPITKTPVHEKVWEKLMAIVKDQGYAIVEPYLNKILDFSFQFELKKGKVSFLGISNFMTDQKGQYQGNYLNGLPLTIGKTVSEFTDFVAHRIRRPLITAIETSDLPTYYEGVFGVDTLIYSDEKNRLKINPCLEINIRHTMGLLALELEKIVCQKKQGVYRTFYKPGTSFYTFKNEMDKKYPLKISKNKIESGFMPLTEAAIDSLFGAYILV